MKYLQTESLDANYMFQAFENQTCRLTVAKEVIMNRHYFMMVIKNSPFTQELNKGLNNILFKYQPLKEIIYK